MSVQIRVMKQQSIADSLKVLMELVNDPKAIKVAHDTLRKELILTETEHKKVEEARIIIKKHDEHLLEIKKLHETLAKDKKDHEDKVNEHIIDYESRKEELNNILSAINNKKLLVEEAEKNNAITKADMHAKHLATEKEHSRIFNMLQDKEAELTKREAELVNNEERTRILEKTLQERETKLKSFLGS